jgi:hypothetical protein
MAFPGGLTRLAALSSGDDVFTEEALILKSLSQITITTQIFPLSSAARPSKIPRNGATS